MGLACEARAPRRGESGTRTGAGPERRGGGGERPPHRRRPRREVTARGAGREPEPPEPSDAGTQRRKGRGGHAQSPAAGHTRPVTRTRPVTLPGDAVTATGNCPDEGLSPQHALALPVPQLEPPPQRPWPRLPPPGGWNGHPAAPGPRPGTRTGGGAMSQQSAGALCRPRCASCARGGPRGPHRRRAGDLLPRHRVALTERPGGPAAVRPGAAAPPPRWRAPAQAAPPRPPRNAGCWEREAAPRDAEGAQREHRGPASWSEESRSSSHSPEEGKAPGD